MQVNIAWTTWAYCWHQIGKKAETAQGQDVRLRTRRQSREKISTVHNVRDFHRMRFNYNFRGARLSLCSSRAMSDCRHPKCWRPSTAAENTTRRMQTEASLPIHRHADAQRGKPGSPGLRRLLAIAGSGVAIGVLIFVAASLLALHWVQPGDPGRLPHSVSIVSSGA